jgi:hypothetical protein
MSSSPIILQTVADLGGVTQLKAAMDTIPASTDRATESFHRAATASNEFGKEVAYLNSINMRAKAPFDEAAAGADELGYSVREARGSARLLADELGLHLNRELANTLARSEVLGPLLEKAFNIFAVVGFLEVLGEVPEAIDKIVGKLSGWDEAARKAYEGIVKENLKAVEQNLDLEQSADRAATVGLEGSKKYAAEQANLQKELHSSALQAGELQQQVVGMQDKMDQLKPSGLSLWQTFERDVISGRPLIEMLDGTNTRYKELNESAEAFSATIRKLTEEQRKEAEAESVRIKAEEAANAAADSEATSAAKIAHEKDYVSAVEGYNRQMYEDRLKLQQISLAQEEALNRASEEREFQAETAAYQKLRALKIDEGARTGKNVQPEIEKMDSDQENRRIAFNKKLADSDTQTALTERKNAEDVATAQIEATYKVEEAQDKLDESRAKRLIAKADSPAKSELAEKQAIDAANEAYDHQADKVKALARLQESLLPTQVSKPVSALGSDAFADELKDAEKYAPEIAKKLLDLNAELQQINKERAGSIEAIQNESHDKEIEQLRAGLDEKKSILATELEDVRSTYTQESAALISSMAERGASIEAYGAKAAELSRRELATETALYEKELADIREAAANKVITEQQATSQIEAIYKQQEQSYAGMLQSENQNFERALSLRQAQEKASIAGTGSGPLTEIAQQRMLVEEYDATDQEIKRLTLSMIQYESVVASLKATQANGGILTPAENAQMQIAENNIRNLTTLISQLREKQAQLQTEMVSSWQAITRSIQSTVNVGFNSFNQNLLKMLDSTQSFSKTMINVYNSMVQTLLSSLLKFLEQRLVAWVENELQIGQQQATGGAAQIAAAKTVQAGITTAMAGEAAAAAFAAAMVATPYPEDFAVAAVSADAAAAAVMATIAFERGGIVPGSSGTAVPVLAHAKEMVLPEHLSTFVQDAAAGKIGSNPTAPAGTTIGGNSSTVHNKNNFEMHFHGGETSKDDVIDWVKQGIRQGTLP